MEDQSAASERIERNLGEVRSRMADAARRVGRDPASVLLVAVTKGRPPSVVRLAYQAGVRDFGENRVDEALEKQAALADLRDIRWHMIGHIQSRKARRVAPAFPWIHSVDRLKIARLLDRHAGNVGKRPSVLLECNVSGEPSKAGWALADQSAWLRARSEFAEVERLPNLDVRGLMTMAPWTPDMETVRSVFRRLRKLRDDLAESLPGRWDELSMGMTDDFEVAIEEGATMVRIGRAIFGPLSEPS